ncbi:hypothetical protein A4G20_04930 [Pasteurellaceae bacterium RH1A]|nr:hypothetical protein A4G20_04930 [Pasteurellaceae bacterium RH1A]
MPNSPIEIIADSTRQGLGIGRIFEVNMAQFTDKDDFIPILKRHWRQYPPLYLYYVQTQHRPQKVQVVIEFLLEKSGQG